MSTTLPSCSAMPLVTRGTAITPPVPVVFDTPAPSRRNQVSTVNCSRPRPGAGPKVTYAFVPPKSSAVFIGASVVAQATLLQPETPEEFVARTR